MQKWQDILRGLALPKSERPAPKRRVEKTEAEWATLLSPEAFHVTRRAGTERPFESDLCSLFEPGIYACVCCDTPLFDANAKFDSKTGWPSFTAPLEDGLVAYHSDESRGRVRVETVCATCDAHLGHVFEDGPEPTGLRYCMNAVALKKIGK